MSCFSSRSSPRRRRAGVDRRRNVTVTFRSATARPDRVPHQLHTHIHTRAPTRRANGHRTAINNGTSACESVGIGRRLQRWSPIEPGTVNAGEPGTARRQCGTFPSGTPPISGNTTDAFTYLKNAFNDCKFKGFTCSLNTSV